MTIHRSILIILVAIGVSSCCPREQVDQRSFIDSRRFDEGLDRPDPDGFRRAFYQFSVAALASDVKAIAQYASPEVESHLPRKFDDELDPKWRLHDPHIIYLTRTSFDDCDLVFARVVIADRIQNGSSVYVMHWARRFGKWQFLDFPFWGTNVVPVDVFANNSLHSLAEEYRKAAEPGATDNPDDAQRLREDH